MIPDYRTIGPPSKRNLWDRLMSVRRYGETPSLYISRVISELRPKDRILEICAGYGRHSIAVAEQGHSVYHLDLSSEALKQAKNRLHPTITGNIIFVQGDALQLPFEPDSFDIVYSLYAFSIFTKEEAAQALKEIHRVLRKGGRSMHTFLTINDGEFGIGEEIVENTFVQDDGQTVKFYELEEVRELIENCGFRVNNIERIREDCQILDEIMLSESFLVNSARI